MVFAGARAHLQAEQQRKARQGVQVPYASRTASLTEEMGMQSVESSVSRFPVFSRYYCSFFFMVFFWRRVLYEMDVCKVLYYMVRRRSLYCPARRGA